MRLDDEDRNFNRSKWLLRVAAVIEIVLGALIVTLALIRQPFDSTAAQTAQIVAWQSVPRWQVFVAMHALMIGVGGTVLSLVGIVLLWRPARWFGLFGLCGLFAYYRFEPRYEAANLSTHVHAAGLLFCGWLAASLFVKHRSESMTQTIAGLAVLSFVVWSTVIGLLPKTLTENMTDALETRLKVVSIVLGGGLLAWSWTLLPMLAAEAQVSPESPHHRRLLRTFRYCSFLMLAVSALLLLSGGIQKLLWLPAIPFVPALMAVYAPFTWFTQAGPGGIFSNAELGDDRSRFFLGILFQYLTVGMIVFAIGAFRKRLSVGASMLAVFWWIAYWLPALWFAWALSSYGTGGA